MAGLIRFLDSPLKCTLSEKVNQEAKLYSVFEPL